MRLLVAALLALAPVSIVPPVAGAAVPSAAEKPGLFLVVGAPGEDEFGQDFTASAERVAKTARNAGLTPLVIGLGTNVGVSDRERLQQALAAEPREGSAELWLLLLGHGTFDGREAKFNLRGADVSAGELAEWLKPIRRPVAVVNTASASAPFLARLAATNRVLVTATRTGSEVNFTRLGQYLSEAIADPGADLDKDGQTSLLESFLFASRGVAEFYKTEGRLSTEHALLDDNGDGLGTPPDWFRGLRAVKTAKTGASPDGFRAHQWHLVRSEAEQNLPPAVRARRDEIEMAVLRLRRSKAELDEEEYYRDLETLLLEMARLYEQGGVTNK